LLLLRKRGFTTMEAVRNIADALGLPQEWVGYCGLKDEDGVTEQLISIPITLPASGIERHEAAVDRWYTTHHYGFSGAALRIGQMEGNSFKIILRDLDSRHVTGFFGRKKINFMFLNYFDTQRFGVPGGPRRTHLVGAAMLDGRWDDARRELVTLNAPESRLAADWRGTSRDFFLHLDERVRSFYSAAHASFLWNSELARLCVAADAQRTCQVAVDGIDFTYVTDVCAAARVMAEAYELPIERYKFANADAPTLSASVRATVVHTVIEVAGRDNDEHFPGRARVELSFFLPSGSYATAAIRQLVMQVS
jgi:tRNA pseudouridine13 synthase